MWKRARLIETGWDRDLEIEEVAEVPQAGGDLVVVRIEACGVCYRDCIDRAGRFAFLRTPITPGHEAVGRVVAVGDRVTEWRVGDRVASMHRGFCGVCEACKAGEISLCASAASVLGLLIDGGYGQYLAAPERCFYAVPERFPAAQAAVLHCTFGTAYRGLVRFGQLTFGQRVLVTGANGGVGSAAVAVASRLGAEVVAVIRDPAHEAFVTEIGAAEVIVDASGGFHRKLRGRVDVAIDCVGQPTFNASLRSLRVGGSLVVVGNIAPERAELNLGYLITQGIRVAGSSGANRRDMAEVIALWDAEPLPIPLHAELPLERADQAQRMVRAGGLRGRIVLLLED